MLGPKTAMEFGKTLKVNKTLMFLNLESNTLASLDGADSIGMYEFMKFLPENTTLLSLSIANNQLDHEIGKVLKQALEQNTTLIDLDYSMNFFTMLDSQEIQDILIANKEAFDAERLAEWRERKSMKSEDTGLKTTYLQENAAVTQFKMEQDAREKRESELNAKWSQKMVETEIEKQQLIE